jgi:hypothetical protein
MVPMSQRPNDPNNNRRPNQHIGNNQESFLCDANDYNRRHRPAPPTRPNNDRRRRPEHYAILDEMQ